MNRKFQVGDRVSWCGVPGKIVKDYKFKFEEAASLEVEFDIQTSISGGRVPHTANFLYDGRLLPWHSEPSLKLLESK